MFPLRCFLILRHQLLDRKLWCPLFLLSLKFFDARSFLKHRRDHLQSFSTMWEKRFPSELSDIIVLCKDVSTPELFWNTEGFPYDSSRYCETKTLTKNRNTPASSSIHKSFRYPKYLKDRCVPLRKFWTQWDKKLLAQKNGIPFLCVKFFDTRHFFWNTEGLACEFFRYCETSTLRSKFVISRVSFILKLFGCQKFLKNRRDHVQIFRHCETNDFQRNLVISPSYAKMFRYQNFSETQKGSATKFFDAVRQKFFNWS